MMQRPVQEPIPLTNENIVKLLQEQNTVITNLQQNNGQLENIIQNLNKELGNKMSEIAMLKMELSKAKQNETKCVEKQIETRVEKIYSKLEPEINITISMND